jgi:hypothetical protein
LSQAVKDGFEGAGLLVETLLAVGMLTAIFPVIAFGTKLIGREKTSHSGYIWSSIAANCFSLIVGYVFVALCLTEEVTRTALMAWAGSTLAVVSLVFAAKGNGPGRKPALCGAFILTLVWLPFLIGRGFGLS